MFVLKTMLKQVFRLVEPAFGLPTKMAVAHWERRLSSTYGGGSAPDLNGIPY